MNVASVMTTGNGDFTSISGGQTLVADQGMMGAMFAVQMENALGQTSLTDLIPELKGEGDFSNLQDLLALLQQMFTNSPLMGQQPVTDTNTPTQSVTNLVQTDAATVPGSLVNAQTTFSSQIETSTSNTNPIQVAVPEEKLAQLQQFLSQLLPEKTPNVALQSETLQPVVATFMQQGLSQQEATDFVQSLAQLAKAGDQAKQPEVRVAAEQISQLMTQLGVKTADGKELNAKKITNSFDTLLKKSSTTQPLAERSMSQSVQTVQTPLNLLKVNKALSSYQVETGLVSRNQGNSGITIPANAIQIVASTEPEDGDETLSINVSQPQVPSTFAIKSNQTEQPVSTYTVKADQFANQVSDVFVKQLKVGSLKGLTEAKIILHPQSLGQVDVKITAHNGMITAQFSVDNRAGKEVLDSQLSQLRTALVQQGLQVDRLEVTQQQSQDQQFSFQQQKEQSKQQQSFKGQQQNQQSQSNETSFSIEQHVDTDTSTAALWNRARMAGYVNYSA